MSDPRRRILLALQSGGSLSYLAGVPRPVMLRDAAGAEFPTPRRTLFRGLERDGLIEEEPGRVPGHAIRYRLTPLGREVASRFRTRST